MPQALIILTTMRSYSSLVSTMLGQHPQLYGLPELNLFAAQQLQDLLGFSKKVRPNTLHGLLRTVAELEFGNQSAASIQRAAAWLKQRARWSGARMLQHIARRVAPRACIEKSPSTVLRPEFIQNAYRTAPQAHFLHLVRHPRATCNSLHRLVTETDRLAGRQERELDPEQVWLDTNRNILEFMDTLPPGQGIRIRGEDLLGEPDVYLPQLCQWMGVRDDEAALEAMRHPEQSPYASIGPPAARFGNDPNFLRNPTFTPREIPEQSLEGALEWTPGDTSGFSADTIRIARRLGYR